MKGKIVKYSMMKIEQKALKRKINGAILNLSEIMEFLLYQNS